MSKAPASYKAMLTAMPQSTDVTNAWIVATELPLSLTIPDRRVGGSRPGVHPRAGRIVRVYASASAVRRYEFGELSSRLVSSLLKLPPERFIVGIVWRQQRESDVAGLELASESEQLLAGAPWLKPTERDIGCHGGSLDSGGRARREPPEAQRQSRSRSHRVNLTLRPA
jgi:hypothetical protein